MFKKRFVVIFLVLFFAIPAYCETQEEYIYYNPQGHFSFKIPDNWIQIPDEILREYVKALRQTYSAASKIDYDAAFQKISDQYFTYPRVMIKIDNRGRYNLEKMKEDLLSGKAEKGLIEGLKKAEKAASDTVKSTKFDRFTYDPEKQIFFARQEAILAEVGKIKTITAIILSNYGSIRIMFHTTEDAFLENIASFNHIVNSFQFDDGYKYIKD